MVWSLLADMVVAIHFLYILFTVAGEALILAGGLLRWKWVRNRIFRIIHLIAVLFVAAEALIGVLCPLTELEYRLRSLAGQFSGEKLSFVARLIHRIIFYDFPEIFFILLYVGFGILVTATIFMIPMNRKKTAGRRDL